MQRLSHLCILHALGSWRDSAAVQRQEKRVTQMLRRMMQQCLYQTLSQWQSVVIEMARQRDLIAKVAVRIRKGVLVMAWRTWCEVLEDARAAAAAAAAADAARKERIRQREMAKRKQLGFEPRIGLEVRAKKRPIGHRFYDPNKVYDAVIEDVDNDTGTMTVRYLDEGKRGIVDNQVLMAWSVARPSVTSRVHVGTCCYDRVNSS